jgi:hypothetical protein
MFRHLLLIAGLQQLIHQPRRPRALLIGLNVHLIKGFYKGLLTGLSITVYHLASGLTVHPRVGLVVDLTITDLDPGLWDWCQAANIVPLNKEPTVKTEGVWPSANCDYEYGN